MEELLQMLFGGGQGAGAALGGPGAGGVPAPTMPGAGNPNPGLSGSPVPYGAETAALPGSVGPAPQDLGPSPGSGGPADTMTQLRGALGVGQPGTPMMPGSQPVRYQAPTMSLGEALQPAPPPSATPMPISRPPGLGAGGAGATPGNYGGSPETNPNLKPVGSPATKTPPVDLTKLLSGIKPPARPDVVKPSTPAAPQMKAPGASELLQLLSALGMGGSRGMRMPTTLGQALELKPSAWGGVYG